MIKPTQKNTEPRNPVGRPKGYSPGLTRKLTDQVDQYSWDSVKLENKIRTTATGCFEWLGSRGPFGNLFGIYKNGQSRMIQTNRVLYMATTGQNVDGLAIYMQCGNKYCCNPDHFDVRESKRKPGANS